MHSSTDCFTPFNQSIETYTFPERFTFPFYYQPHPLCILAAEQLQQHLLSQTEWQHNFGVAEDAQDPAAPAIGKMFGVLVVENPQGEIGFLSAFSGKIADRNLLPHFVPPVFDMLAEDGFFRNELDEVTQVSNRLKELQADPKIDEYERHLASETANSLAEIEAHRNLMIEGRKSRKERRAQGETNLNDDDFTALSIQLSRESVAEKNQLKALKSHWQEKIDLAQQQLLSVTDPIIELKQTRKQLSNALQNKLFDQYRFLKIDGEEKSLGAIFKQMPNHVPPAGAGECAAPKLLQFAFKHKMKPIAMAEFWWGSAPKSEIRQHKKFYAACMGKCHPILGHMLEGMEIDDNPLLNNPAEGKTVEIIYQDDDIAVVNKPAEFLSVPGKTIEDSVYLRMKQQFPDATGPLIVHRLDMSTSGLMVIVLSKRANKSLQKQFISRSVKKRYVALIDGELEQDEGVITLPMRGDLYDRPRQLVCFEHGKPAETKWQVVGRQSGKTKVHLYPKTGRTHQLRVHCAHHLGLNMPIVGDDLYGLKADRLHLHAETLELEHPITKEIMQFQAEADF